MNNEEMKDELEDLDLEMYELEEELRDLKIKRDKLQKEYKCEHIYQQDGYTSSIVINNKRVDTPIIKCIKCGDLAHLKIGR